MILTVVPRPESPEALRTSAFNQIESIWDTFDRKRKHYLATDDFPGEDWGYELRGFGWRGANFRSHSRILLYTYRSVMNFEGFGEKDEPKMPHAQKHFSFLGAQTIDAADRTWLIRKPALEEIFIQPANRERIWLKLSPVGLYDAATQAWAGTDLLGIRDFLTPRDNIDRTSLTFSTIIRCLNRDNGSLGTREQRIGAVCRSSPFKEMISTQMQSEHYRL